MNQPAEMLRVAGYDVPDPDEEKLAFAVGDVVQLKSGGPKMTVTGSYSLYVRCNYFDNDGRLFDSSFPPDALTKDAWLSHPPESAA
jgi:uncharacterized protein YodC (DUF2158 family)